MLLPWILLLAVVLGLVAYLASSNAKAAEVGRLVFATALLVTWFVLAKQVLRIG